MTAFPRTVVGGVSLPRLLIGTNWFRGFSHVSAAKDKWIRREMTAPRIAETLGVFLKAGVDAVMSGDLDRVMLEALQRAEDRAGRGIIRIITPHFNIQPGGPDDARPERVFDRLKEEWGATFAMPHQCVTDALADRMIGKIRDLGKYTRMIRERGMIPGLSTHMPETIAMADRNNEDVECYVQLYNAAGFLMPIEADWAQRVIHNAGKPVMVIKPLAAGRLLPPVGLAFVWSTIRARDMVTVGTMGPEEAEEVVEWSLAAIEKRAARVELQTTRSKKSLELSCTGPA